jgi:hypothetical protein
MRMGWQGWSTWGIFLVTGVLQGVLLAMGISFEIRDRRLKKSGLPVPGQSSGSPDEDEEIRRGRLTEEDDADERTPLVTNRN